MRPIIPVRHTRSHRITGGRQELRRVVDLTDITARARKIATLAQTGQSAKAKRLLPPERVYPVPRGTARSLGIDE
ncbi:hypothetical protein AB0L13_03215 [Saccharopolyspora shandongensis]|uniref:hypothetical protein n=1 Tax=Saccharopolyspora shandongensis TaxID=418495 RepID=UPI0034173CE1